MVGFAVGSLPFSEHSTAAAGDRGLVLAVVGGGRVEAGVEAVIKGGGVGSGRNESGVAPPSNVSQVVLHQ